MANYSLQINSKFRPFSYQEMLHPVQMATEAHRELEDSYSDLSSKAAMIKNMLGNSAEALATYNNYEAELQKNAEILANEGLNNSSRKALNNMKRAYNSDIMPIELGITRREELTKEQRLARSKDPSLIFDVDYSTTSIDDMLNNPNASYNSISGNKLTEKASQISSTLSKIIRESPEIGQLMDGYLAYSQQYGFSPEEVVQTILNDPNAPGELKNIVNAIKSEINYDSWGEGSKRQIDSYISSGIYNAIGQSKQDVLRDLNFVSEADQIKLDREAERLEMEKDRLEIAAISAGLTRNEEGQYEIDPNNPIYKKSQDEVLWDDGNIRRVRTSHGKIYEQDLVTGEVKFIPTSPTASSTNPSSFGKNLSYTTPEPIIVTKDKKRIKVGSAGQDVSGRWLGNGNSNLIRRGNFSLHNFRPSEKDIVSINDVPKEYAEKILDIYKEEKLNPLTHNIIKVPREKQGEYDYVIYPKPKTTNFNPTNPTTSTTNTPTSTPTNNTTSDIGMSALQGDNFE